VIPSVPVHGEWFRCVSLKRDPLSSEGARLAGGRLNVTDEPAIYLASTPTLAVAENLRLADLFGVQGFPPRLLVTVEVTLSRVVDLRSRRTRSALGIELKDLANDWRAESGASPSQLLGLQLSDSGFEGAVCPSVVEPKSANLVVFLRNVESLHSLHVVGGS
jgi:RES domain-containing protein